MVGYAGSLGRLLRGEEAGPIRVLIAIQPRMYGETLAYALSNNRPSAEVVRVEPNDLDVQLEGLGPRLVVCNEATDEVRFLAASWVALSYPKAIEADVCLGGRRSKIEDVRVEDVLAVMDEAELLSAAT